MCFRVCRFTLDLPKSVHLTNALCFTLFPFNFLVLHLFFDLFSRYEVFMIFFHSFCREPYISKFRSVSTKFSNQSNSRNSVYACVCPSWCACACMYNSFDCVYLY